jgi:hypothetical protein
MPALFEVAHRRRRDACLERELVLTQPGLRSRTSQGFAEFDAVLRPSI